MLTAAGTASASSLPQAPARRTRDGDFLLATSEDLDLAIYGDFLMVTDSRPRPGRAFPLDGRSVTTETPCLLP
jgi:hypothetical protein